MDVDTDPVCAPIIADLLALGVRIMVSEGDPVIVSDGVKLNMLEDRLSLFILSPDTASYVSYALGLNPRRLR